MGTIRKINAPGVEVNEIDVSQYSRNLYYLNDSVLVFGFANHGEDLTPITLHSLQDFINKFGYPTNEAERYFYNAAKIIFKYNAQMLAVKLPYSNESFSKYKAITYSVEAGTTTDVIKETEISAIGVVNGSDILKITIDPVENKGNIEYDTYDNYQTGNKDDLANKICIVDITRSKYEIDKSTTNSTEYIGIVPIITTPFNALFYQNILSVSAVASDYDFNNISGIQNLNGAEIISNFNIDLNSTDIKTVTPSKIAQQYFTKLPFIAPKQIDQNNLHKVGIVVFKLKNNPANNKIDFIPVESFVGSLNKNSKDTLTKTSNYIDDIVNENSKYINVFSNFTGDLCSMIETEKYSLIATHSDYAYSLGFFKSELATTIDYNTISNNIDTLLKYLIDRNSFVIDLVVDAGISTIEHILKESSTTDNSAIEYDPSNNAAKDILFNYKTYESWRTIIDKFKNFCQNDRKDCMFIADAPRTLCLRGNSKVVRRSTILTKTVETEIIPNIQYLTGINTSYGAGYCNWFKCVDEFSKTYFWLPPSIKALDVYLYCDRYSYTWMAPAGLNRGKIYDVVDVAFNPSFENMEKIYINSWNSAVSYPYDGIILEGQKTFQTYASAFDRVSIRRLFLRMEREIRRIGRRFVYEKLTDITFSNFRSAISAYLENIKINNGIIDFYVICDERNNTAETIENNELHCSIGIKPTKDIEFVVLNFICTNQSANIEEVTTQYM